MILDEQQLEKIIVENPSAAIITEGRKINATLTKYVTGRGLKEALDKLPYFEKDELSDIRKKLTRSTRDLFDRLLSPVEKVFTAKGGVIKYNLPASEETNFAKRMDNVRKGMSMDEWVHHVALPAYLIDPMSILHTEIDGEGNSYPTYKSISVIYDYKLNGRKVEYVAFLLTQSEIDAIVASGKVRAIERGEKLYRVIDDDWDMYVINKGKKVPLEYKLPNFFKYVPAQLSSDIAEFGTDMFESPLAPIMELAADYFNDNSSKSLFKKFQMHLKEWGIAVDCKRCDGTGLHDGKDCKACNGKGIRANINVAEKLVVAVNEDGQAKVPIPPGGYIAPPVESWDMMNQELDAIKQDFHDTFWSSNTLTKTQGPDVQQNNSIQTATGEVYNERSKEAKLKKFSKWAQTVFKFQADNIKKVVYRNVNIGESTVSYGDRYLLESPDELKSKYLELKKNNATYPILDKALTDSLESEYANDSMEMRRQQILMRLEPYVHHELSVVMGWAYLPEIIKRRKLYFNDWLANTDPVYFYTHSEETIKAAFEAYVAAQPPLVEPQMKPAA